LYRDSLMIEHFKKLVKYEVIDSSNWHDHVKQTHRDWLQRIGEYDDYMLELAAIYINSLKGLNKDRLEFIVDQVITLKGDIVYSFTRERILMHQQMGHKIFFISGSPEHIVAKMANKYDVFDFKGTVYKVDEDGDFTGEVVPMWDSQNKANAIQDFVEKYDIDLETSYAYGDTNGDLSMLKRVGNPVAFNPTKELLKSINSDPHIKEKISIIIERKDVIYKLSPDVDTI
ncbi:MAG: HAD-IB family hydrolase, partial [Acidaminobacteraceae bacterium]